jgi:hypothetical protein
MMQELPLQLASYLSNLSGVPVGNSLGITSDSNRVKGLQLPNSSFTVIDKSADPFTVFLCGSNDLVDGVDEYWFVSSCGSVA